MLYWSLFFYVAAVVCGWLGFSEYGPAGYEFLFKLMFFGNLLLTLIALVAHALYERHDDAEEDTYEST